MRDRKLTYQRPQKQPQKIFKKPPAIFRTLNILGRFLVEKLKCLKVKSGFDICPMLESLEASETGSFVFKTFLGLLATISKSFREVENFSMSILIKMWRLKKSVKFRLFLTSDLPKSCYSKDHRCIETV